MEIKEDRKENLCLNEKLFKLYDHSLLAYLHRTRKQKRIYKSDRYLSVSKKMAIGKYICEPEIERNNNIKVRIMLSAISSWNAVGSLYFAFKAKKGYDTKLIVTDLDDEDLSKKLDFLEQINVDYLIGNPSYGDYNITQDKPDIFVFTNPFRDTYLDNVRECSNVIVVAPFTLIDYSGFVKGTFWDYVLSAFHKYDPDLYFFDSLLYEDITKGTTTDNIEKAGNVKYDDIYNITIGEYNKNRWLKLVGKKVILYATTHGMKNYELLDLVSFDVYWKYLMDWFIDNKEMGLIFRPHPNMINDLIKFRYWTQGDYMKFRRFIQSQPNMIFDDSETYNDAYGICDAIMTDAFCGISISALPMMKPIALLYRNESVPALNKDFDDVLYPIRNPSACIQFLEMVKTNSDPKYDLRKEACQRYILHFDGKNGERLSGLIEDYYFKKIKHYDNVSINCIDENLQL